MFKLDNFGVILFVSFSYKTYLQCSFYESLKIGAKIDFSAKNSKKFVYYNENMYTNSKFQTQLSRQRKRFRIYCKNKKCSNFHELSEYLCKVGDFWNFVYYNENMNPESIQVVYWSENLKFFSSTLLLGVELIRSSTDFFQTKI